MPGSQRSFCSGVPKAITTGATIRVPCTTSAKATNAEFFTGSFRKSWGGSLECLHGYSVVVWESNPTSQHQHTTADAWDTKDYS